MNAESEDPPDLSRKPLPWGIICPTIAHAKINQGRQRNKLSFELLLPLTLLIIVKKKSRAFTDSARSSEEAWDSNLAEWCEAEASLLISRPRSWLVAGGGRVRRSTARWGLSVHRLVLKRLTDLSVSLGSSGSATIASCLTDAFISAGKRIGRWPWIGAGAPLPSRRRQRALLQSDGVPWP